MKIDIKEIEGKEIKLFDLKHDSYHEYKSWGKYPKDFDTISRWFKEDLIPLFYSKIHGVGFDKARKNGYVEGIVFTDPETLKMAKLRRDMFDWYSGPRH